MFAAVVFLLASLTAGVLLSARAVKDGGMAVRLGVGGAFGLAIALWLPLITSLPLGLSIGIPLAFVIVLGLLIYELSMGKIGAKFGSETSGALTRLQNDRSAQLTALCLAVLLLFGTLLFYTHWFEAKPDGLYSAGNAWGDSAFHASLASSFLNGDNLHSLQYPVYAGWPLGYPFVSDFLAAALQWLGMDIGASFWASASLAFIIFCILTYSLGREWLGAQHQSAALGTIAMFLLSGGIGGYFLLASMMQGAQIGPLLLNTDYANQHSLGIDYTNIFNSLFLPARTALFGMALGAAVLLLLSRAVSRKDLDRNGLLAAGILAGTLPLVHTHTALAVYFVSACYFVMFKPGRWKEWAWYFVPMAILALPQIVWSSHQLVASGTSFLRMHLGWMSDAPSIEAWVVYWLANAGPFLLLAIAGWFAADARLKRLSAPLLALFVVSNLIVFQPFVYDNIKLLAYFQLGGSILAAGLLVKIVHWHKLGNTAAIALFTLCIFTGAVVMAREVQLSSQLVDNSGVEFARLVASHTSPQSVILTSSDHNHPVPMLAGRTIVLGYKGWLWTHGIAYSQRERDVKEIYAGTARARELLAAYNVSYVVIGPNERNEFPALNEAYFQQSYTPVLRSGQYALYQVTP